MANLPEVSAFDAGVYQLEVTDRVLGGSSGVMNAAAKNLANRTRYLRDRVDVLGAMFIGMTFEWNGPDLPPGFLWEDGANYSRDTYALLFAKIGTTFGAGDGSTTFGVPDSRGRVAVGRDNMGGSIAGRLTGDVSGLSGTTLGGSGGDQRAQAHAHSVSDAGHTHGVNDQGHGHGVSDPGHTHGYLSRSSLIGSAPGGDAKWEGGFTDQTGLSGTGISINGALTGIWLSSSGTGVAVLTAGAGGSQNIPPSIIKNKIIFSGVFS